MKTSALNESKRSRYDDRKHQDLQQHAAANHLQQWIGPKAGDCLCGRYISQETRTPIDESFMAHVPLGQQRLRPF